MLPIFNLIATPYNLSTLTLVAKDSFIKLHLQGCSGLHLCSVDSGDAEIGGSQVHVKTGLCSKTSLKNIVLWLCV